MHMHFGAEEMFFVLSGHPLFRGKDGEETLALGDYVFCPEGRAGVHTFANPGTEPAQVLGISAGSFPDVVAYPEHGYAWVATRDPDPRLVAQAEDPAAGEGIGFFQALALAGRHHQHQFGLGAKGVFA